MTYEEVVKALECCNSQAKCVECPLYDTYGLNCIGVLRQATFDLLRKQKAEIKALDFSVKSLSGMLKTARAEAIKEFAERAKEELLGWDSDPKDEDVEWTIDNLVKEMVGERE